MGIGVFRRMAARGHLKLQGIVEPARRGECGGEAQQAGRESRGDPNQFLEGFDRFLQPAVRLQRRREIEQSFDVARRQCESVPKAFYGFGISLRRLEDRAQIRAARSVAGVGRHRARKRGDGGCRATQLMLGDAQHMQGVGMSRHLFQNVPAQFRRGRRIAVLESGDGVCKRIGNHISVLIPGVLLFPTEVMPRPGRHRRRC